jgi:hypothetical protein
MDGGRMVRASKENILDKYLKYGKAMTEIMGGPQGAELDNLTNMEKVLMVSANLWGASASGNEDFGKFISGLFSLKADSMFYPGYKSGADQVLNKIRGLDVFSGEKEKQAALAGALGERGNLAHGWVAEARRLYHIDLLEVSKDGVAKYPEYWNAYLRVFMDTPDINEAKKKYKTAMSFLTERVGSTVTGGAAEMFAVLKK